jgi:hypothetical protein
MTCNCDLYQTRTRTPAPIGHAGKPDGLPYLVQAFRQQLAMFFFEYSTFFEKFTQFLHGILTAFHIVVERRKAHVFVALQNM